MGTLVNMIYVHTYVYITSCTCVHVSVQYVHIVSRYVRMSTQCNKSMTILRFIQLDEAGIAGSNGTFLFITCIFKVK